jgi:hypothetical protein
MPLLHLAGTVLWACLLILFGALALSNYGWAWVALSSCLAVFVVLAVAAQRPKRSFSQE